MPVRINAPPLHCSNDRRSPRTSQDVTAANSGSKQKISAARAVDISRWARICSRKQMVLANSTVYRSAPAKRGVQWMCGRSNSAVAGAATTAVAAIWKNTRRRGSYRRASSAPPESSRPAGRGRNRVPGASASAAMLKRTVRNANGVASASALLTATKLVPQSAVASSSARSACRRVIAPSGRSRDVPEIASRGRVGVASDVLRSPLRDDAPARVAGARSQLDHPVGPLDDVEMVLDDEHAVAGVDEPVEHAAQRSDVVEVQSRRRLVEDVELAPGAAFPARERELACDLQALRLAAGQRGRGLAELQVSEPDLLQVPQGARQPRLAVEALQRLVHGPLEHVVDRAAAELHLEHRFLEALARADVAGHEHVGEEHHIDQYVPRPFAGLAPPPGHVERERAGRVRPRAGQRLGPAQGAPLVERPALRNRVGAPPG